VTDALSSVVRARRALPRWLLPLIVVLIAIASLAVAWQSQRRIGSLEQELVRRQQQSQEQSAEAKLLAKQAQDSARETAAKAALLEARVAETALTRSQLEELLQSVARSRDENMLTDIEASLRVAQRQALVTGSAEPLVAALTQADERLTRYDEPRLDGVRRAIARDLDRARAVSVADIAALTIRLDEAVRLVDEMALLAAADPARRAAETAPSPSAPPTAPADGWWRRWPEGWIAFAQRVWGEVRSLVRVTRIDHPDAALVAPEQALFLRENLKLRLLNARLALLSRQFDTTQADLQAAQAVIERYFDRSTRKAAHVAELVRQVAAQSRQVVLPRPDDTLAALAAASAGR
jgi:uroporphyrin-3 C-methyltransferase